MPFGISPVSSPIASLTPFAATIPLDGLRYMPRQSVSGPLAFSAGAVSPGGECRFALISNGSNAPTFSGMVEDSSSQGWLSTQYAVNNLTFWADDTTTYFAIRQAASPQMVYPAATAYTLTGPTSASVGAASTYTVQSNGSLASAVTVTPSDGGAGGTFSPTSVSIGTGYQASATFTYTPKATGTVSLSATNSGGLTNPAVLSVTVAAALSVVNIRLTGLNGLTEAADGSGYDYTAGSTSYSTNYGVSTVGIPAGADGWFAGNITTPSSTNGSQITGMSPSSSSVAYTSMSYAVYADISSSANYQVVSNGAGAVAPQTAVAIAANDRVRMRRSGTTVIGEVSKDNGSTWTTVYTWTGASTAKLYGNYCTGNAGSPIKLPTASSNAS